MGGGPISGSSEPLPSLLGAGMSDLEASLEIWIDDLQLGSGDPEDEGPEGGFEEHLEALRRVLERAAVADLRFKLVKCFFC